MAFDNMISSLYDELYPIKETTRACGKYVVFQILEDERTNKVGDIIMPENFKNTMEHENFKLMKCRIVSIGKDAENEGIKVGDVVLLDKWGCFGRVGYQPGKYGVIDVENIILICEE